MPATDTPQTRARAYVGETPRPRVPQPLTKMLGSAPLSSVSRMQQGYGDPATRTAGRQVSGGTASATRPEYTSVPRWPTPTDYNDQSVSRHAAPSFTPMHDTAPPRRPPPTQRQAPPFGDVSVTTTAPPAHCSAGPESMPIYASTSRIHQTPRPHVGFSGGPRDDHVTASRLLNDDHMTMTASRMLSGPPQSQEVVLFALHPQTVVRPLRRAVRQVFAGLLEWLLETLQRHGMPRNVALARLNRTRWFGRLFDYVAVERMLNIFKLYLSQSDVLAVPRDFVDVYDAFSHEINRYCLSESVQPRADAPHGNRAFVVGGIDFTEETLKSMTRSLDPWPHQAQQTPLYPGKATSGGSAGAAGGSASPGAPSDTAHTSAPAGALVSVNRRYLVSQDNLALVGNMVARLQGALRQRKKALDVLLRERAELDAQLKSRKRELLDLCVSLTNKRILADSLDFEATLLEVRQQFDPLSGAHRNSRALEEISQHMRVINRCAKAFARK